MTQLTLARSVDVPFSAAVDYASQFFDEHPSLRLRAFSAEASVKAGFRTVDDVTDHARGHDAVVFAWYPKHPLLPALCATLRVRPDYHGATLLLDAQYSPPLRSAGRVFDRIAGRHIARATMNHFLDDVAAFMKERYARFLSTTPSAPHQNSRSTEHV